MIKDHVSPLSWITNKDFLAKYEPIKVIGSGGQAKMFKCKLRGSTDDKFFAAKVYMPENLFLVECETKCLMLLNHPSAVNMFDSYGVNDDGTLQKDTQIVVVMTFVDGKNIMEHFAEKAKEKTIEKDRALIFKQMLKMAEVIEYLHSELFMMHRDLHIMNWMMSKEGEPVITDFGTGIVLGKDGYTERGLYTPMLGAPE